jgi:molybdate transport system ATP-binding protein
MSGGQQQRAAMARIMAYNPEIIMLDEPFSALDGHLKDILQQDLLETLREYKKDVLMVSHSRNEIFKFCDNITIMEQGQVVSEGNTREIFRKPLTKGAARLTGCKNISKIRRISEYELEALDWGICLKTEVPINDKIVYVGFRGHRFQVVEKDKLAETENVIPIQLMRYAEEPFEVQYIVRNSKYPQGKDIWWIEPKKEFNSIIRNEMPEYLIFPKEELMLLEK